MNDPSFEKKTFGAPNAWCSVDGYVCGVYVPYYLEMALATC